MLISKDQSDFIKGIAVILMMFHHLFAYSDRIPSSINIHWIFNDILLEQYIGLFGKYCVPIFLFLSGYGFSVSGNNRSNYTDYYLRKILKFFVAYWIVFVIFVPLSYFFSEYKFVVIEPKAFLLNLIGISDSYNREWWFVFTYILLILITPLMLSSKYKLPIIGISIILFSMSFSFYGATIQNFLFWQPAYIIGFLYAQIKKDSIYLLDFKFSSLIEATILIFAWYIFDWEGMPFLVILLIDLLIKVFNINNIKLIKESFISLGKHSLFIWLTHSFYCYHFAKPIVYYYEHSLLIFITLLIMSYCTSIILNKIYYYILTTTFIKKWCN